jgi:hypothetical protein
VPGSISSAKDSVNTRVMGPLIISVTLAAPS